MSTLERQAHWQNVYQTKGERAVSWFQETPDISLDLIHSTGVDASGSIIDIGGGASRLSVSKAVRIGGHVIIGTFAPDGPERCSGLPVIRHDATTLGE